METYTNLYPEIYSMGNLTLAWRKARKGKTTKHDIVAFEQDIAKNLLDLHNELKNKTYKPRELHNFILRDPKTRKISKSDFRDRIIHHAIINVIGNVFERGFIYDSCANQKNKGSSFALKRFDKFVRKSGNKCCLKADIKHYFQEVDHNVLLEIISYRIKDEMVLWLINQVLKANFLNAERERE